MRSFQNQEQILRSAQDDNQGTIASLRMTALFCHPEAGISAEGSRF